MCPVCLRPVRLMAGMRVILSVSCCPGSSGNHPGGHLRGQGSLCKAGFREPVVELAASLRLFLPTKGSG